ncbi:hypothetical protein [Palaeococcus ferrophilus]|uniref:hypothetical protein n=1 Tax=Palaeococcus ferrophilus TaxID=83868 RepID=UPI00147727C7|nr:hypothetical protein [Palaeococcus ferrophilus]
MMGRINGKLVEFIVENTKIDRETVIRVLKAEEVFFAREVENALNRPGSGKDRRGYP